jgi:hypothetical protein
MQILVTIPTRVPSRTQYNSQHAFEKDQNGKAAVAARRPGSAAALPGMLSGSAKDRATKEWFSH